MILLTYANERDSLSHHGVKGQKWGVRRYQNPDGTLTDIGRKKYSKKATKLERKARIYDGKAAENERAKTILTKVGAINGGVLGGTSTYLLAAALGAPFAPVGYGVAAGAAAGAGMTSAMYSKVVKHNKRLANKKYSEAKAYRDALEQNRVLRK